MDHEHCTKLIKDAGDSIDIKIERYLGLFISVLLISYTAKRTKLKLSMKIIFSSLLKKNILLRKVFFLSIVFHLSSATILCHLCRGDFIVPNMDEAFPKKKDEDKNGNDKKSSVNIILLPWRKSYITIFIYNIDIVIPIVLYFCVPNRENVHIGFKQ